MRALCTIDGNNSSLIPKIKQEKLDKSTFMYKNLVLIKIQNCSLKKVAKIMCGCCATQREQHVKDDNCN